MPRSSEGQPSTLGRSAFDSAPMQGSSSGTARADLLRDAPNRSDFGSGVNQLEPRGSKRKAISLSDPNRNTPTSRPRAHAEVKDIRAPRAAVASGSGSSSGKQLGAPRVQSSLRATPRGGTDEYFIEAENSSGKGKNKVTFIEDDADVWIDYLPTAILALAISENFVAVACEDGNLSVYTHAGRQ